jgi:hypothetical protein
MPLLVSDITHEYLTFLENLFQWKTFEQEEGQN